MICLAITLAYSSSTVSSASVVSKASVVSVCIAFSCTERPSVVKFYVVK